MPETFHVNGESTKVTASNSVPRQILAISGPRHSPIWAQFGSSSINENRCVGQKANLKPITRKKHTHNVPQNLADGTCFFDAHYNQKSGRILMHEIYTAPPQRAQDKTPRKGMEVAIEGVIINSHPRSIKGQFVPNHSGHHGNIELFEVGANL